MRPPEVFVRELSPEEGAPAADRRGPVPSAHPLVEVEPGPGLPLQGRACALPLQSPARGRGGGVLRRDGTDPADPPARLGLDAGEATRPAQGDLQASPRRALPLRRL